MSGLGRPVADPVAGIGYECLLCGGHAHAYSEDEGHTVDVWELCRRCNSAFAGLADALAAAEDARTERAAVVAQVAGQLELVESACLCGHAQGSHVDPTPEVLYVCIECDCELFEVES